MGNRSAFSLEAIHAEVFSRTPKFTSRPELCPAWDSHLTLRQGPKLRKIDMPSESDALALGKGPGVAYSIPSSLAISLRTDTLWGPPARVSGLVFSQLLEGHPPLYWVGCGKSRWRERGRTSRCHRLPIGGNGADSLMRPQRKSPFMSNRNDPCRDGVNWQVWERCL